MTNQTTTWKRATELTKEFPKPKYNFTKHLTGVGDFLQTAPLTHKQYIHFLRAAHFWAWYHEKRVSVRYWKMGGGYVGRVTLTHNVRVRDFK